MIRSIFLMIALAMACSRSQWTGEPKPLGRVLAESDVDFGSYASARVLSDGRVLLTDERGSHLWMLDRTLRNARLIGDNTAATGRLMDVPGTWVSPYLGDSTLLIKSGLGTIVILDDNGKPVRRVTARYPAGAGLLPITGEWTSDMVQAPFTERGDMMVLSQQRTTRAVFDTARFETIYVVRTSFADPERRDTVDRLTRQLRRRDTTMRSGSTMSWIVTGDAASMFPDGTIALVRTSTYTVELINRDGTRRSVAIPHDWTVLSPADKEAAMESLRASARTSTFGIETRMDSGRVTAVATSRPRPATVVSRLSDIADSVPPIGDYNQITADADGYLWIKKIVVRTNPYRSVPDHHYDLIDRQGSLVRRVVLPAGSQVKAFAPGVVYYTAEEGGRLRLFMARTR